jgi:hypothetical protein
MQWLVNLFPESDDVKPLIDASRQIQDQDGAQFAAEQNGEIETEQAANPGAGSGVERTIPFFR